MYLKNLSAIILAAGKGLRMFSNIPKVLHKIGTKSILKHIVDTIIFMGIKKIYIICNSQNKNVLKKEIGNKKNVLIRWIDQGEKGSGTGYAVQRVMPILHDDEDVLVINGDIPLISLKTLKKLYLMKKKCDLSLLVGKLINPYGYGRIVRDKNGKVVNVIEHNHASERQKKIKEVYAGVLISISKNLKNWLNKLVFCCEKKKLSFI